jgi:hypothetical protein
MKVIFTKETKRVGALFIGLMIPSLKVNGRKEK